MRKGKHGIAFGRPVIAANMIFRLALVAICIALPLRADSTLSTCTEQTLRSAIQKGGVIQLTCASGTTILLSEPLVVERDTTIMAGTNGTYVISGDSRTRLFVVNPGVQLTLSNVALFSGRHTGTNLNDGGIPDTAGAGIYNNGGTVRIFQARVSSHVVIGATGFPGGPGLEAGDGQSGGDAAGGGIFNRGGTVIASNVVFAANAATGGVGGAGGAGSGGLGGEGGDGGNGGAGAGAAIYSEGGRVELYRCVFTNNVATGAVAGDAGAGSGLLGFHGQAGVAGDGLGGAIGGDAAAVLQIESCSFVSNSAVGADGQNGLNGLNSSDGQAGREGGHAGGGAIYISGILNMTNSTLHGNSSAGGNGGDGGSGVPGFFGTDGGDGGNGGYGSGGALYALGSGRVINSTFDSNTVSGGEGGAAGEGTGVADDGETGQSGPELGGAMYSASPELGLANTILANSIPVNVSGSFRDLGGNLNSDGADPRLLALSVHSEFILTIPLATNSPAINAGLMQFCPPVDQRGSNRWHQCDIGAYEYNGGVLITPTNVSVQIGTSVGTTNLTNSLAISWPTNAHNLSLFVNTNLNSTNWSQLPATPTTVGGNRVLTIPILTNATQRFFRLSTGGESSPPIP